MSVTLLGLDEPAEVTASGHRIWGGMPVELEMTELLYGIVRYAKPSLVVESGTGSGRSTKAIATALRHNGRGVVHSYEPQGPFLAAAEQTFSNDRHVVLHAGFSRQGGLTADLVFVDTGHEREEEIGHWLTHPSRPLVVVHDGNRNYNSFALGTGVLIPGHDGAWIGRGKE